MKLNKTKVDDLNADIASGRCTILEMEESVKRISDKYKRNQKEIWNLVEGADTTVIIKRLKVHDHEVVETRYLSSRVGCHLIGEKECWTRYIFKAERFLEQYAINCVKGITDAYKREGASEYQFRVETLE